MRATHDCFLNLIHLKLEIPLLVTTHSAGDFLAKIKGFLLHTKVTGNGPEVFLKISGGFTLTNVHGPASLSHGTLAPSPHPHDMKVGSHMTHFAAM